MPAEFGATMASALENEGWALRRLFDTLSPAVGGYLRRQGVEDAEAATSEVFVRAFRSLDRFSGDESGFRSWIFTIAHNLVIDDRRRRSRRPRSEPVAEVPDQAVPAVEDEVLAAIGSEDLMRLLGGITPDQRDVIALRVIAGLTVGETAAVLDKAPGAVKALQHRGLHALRRGIAASQAVSPESVSTFPEMT